MQNQKLKFVVLSLLITLAPIQSANASIIDDVFDWIKDTYYRANSAASRAYYAVKNTKDVPAMVTKVSGMATNVSNITSTLSTVGTGISTLATDTGAGITGLGSDISTLATNTGNGITGLGNDIAGLGTDIVGNIETLYSDVKDLALGIDPNAIANIVITEIKNKENCSTLPQKLDGILGQLYIPGLPAELASIVQGVNFTNLGIQGIDPDSATAAELFDYKVKTVQPLSALNEMAQSYYKIPFIIASSIAKSCSNAAHRQVEKTLLKSRLHARIHEALSSDGINNIQFQLPHTSGGYIEDVEVVVADAMSDFSGLGLNIPRNAVRSFEDGKIYYQDKAYLIAYKLFKKSYRSLAKEHKN